MKKSLTAMESPDIKLTISGKKGRTSKSGPTMGAAVAGVAATKD
jgi:hypothetical protein